MTECRAPRHRPTGANSELDLAILRTRGTIAIYANDGSRPFDLDVRRSMALNARYQFVLLYTVGWSWIADAGLPLHRYRLDDSSAAHAAVEQGAVGKVLITIDAD